MEAIRFDSVTFAYHHRAVLDDVSFTVNEGDFVGVIGPNGSGKTTLLKVMLGFLEPQSGSVSIFGEAPTQAQPKLAYVPQALHFDRQFPISVNDLVLSGRLSEMSFLGQYRKEDRERALDALERVRLQPLARRPFATLSSGERQKALLARALVSNPKLLILDEPCSNVDAQAQETIYSVLEELKREVTIVMVTHDLRVASEKVDTILCVEETLFPMKPDQVCEHFAIGLYHGPLKEEDTP